jgi:nucleoid-associated protein YgaU
MFGKRVLLLTAVALVLVVAALAHARGSDGSASETRYVVRAGDTLWEIAVSRYSGDPRAAVWKIERRNGLASAALTPGQALVLPAP